MAFNVYYELAYFLLSPLTHQEISAHLNVYSCPMQDAGILPFWGFWRHFSPYAALATPENYAPRYAAFIRKRPSRSALHADYSFKPRRDAWDFFKFLRRGSWRLPPHGVRIGGAGWVTTSPLYSISLIGADPMPPHTTSSVVSTDIVAALEENVRVIQDLSAQVRALRLALAKHGVTVPEPKRLPPSPRPTFARFSTWLCGDGAQRLYVAGADKAPRDCVGVLDGNDVYFVGSCVAEALGLRPGTDTSEIARDWITAGLLDAHPNWDRHLMNSAKWPRYAPGLGTRRMFRARLDAPSCAG